MSFIPFHSEPAKVLLPVAHRQAALTELLCMTMLYPSANESKRDEKQSK
jgi:hypothetical protein